MQDFELFEADEDGDNSWGRKGNLAGTDSKRSSDQHVGRTEGREKEIVAKGLFRFAFTLFSNSHTRLQKAAIIIIHL